MILSVEGFHQFTSFINRNKFEIMTKEKAEFKSK